MTGDLDIEVDNTSMPNGHCGHCTKKKLILGNCIVLVVLYSFMLDAQILILMNLHTSVIWACLGCV